MFYRRPTRKRNPFTPTPNLQRPLDKSDNGRSVAISPHIETATERHVSLVQQDAVETGLDRIEDLVPFGLVLDVADGSSVPQVRQLFQPGFITSRSQLTP